MSRRKKRRKNKKEGSLRSSFSTTPSIAVFGFNVDVVFSELVVDFSDDIGKEKKVEEDIWWW